jgi:ketosteroid isomerase-like protein
VGNADDQKLEDNRAIANRFVTAFDAADLAGIERLLADDFVWHVAVAADAETEFRPFQSRELQERRNPIPALLQDKGSTLAFFGHLFKTGAEQGRPFRLRLTNVLAEGDQVAFEAEGELDVPDRNRTYRNLYFVLLRIRDGQIVLYKEYQDTLHIYDVFVAE